MKSEIIWTQEHHYRDMVTLADAQAEIEKRDILLQKQGIQATKMKLLVDKQQAEIDVWKQRALNAEGLLIKIRTVHVTKTNGWFEDINYLFKQEGFEWKNGYYEKTKHKGE